jgi:hypothetical protein
MSDLNIYNFPDPTIIKQSIDLTFPLYTFNIKDNLDIPDLENKMSLLRKKYPTSTHTNVVCKSGWRSPYFSRYMNNELLLFADLTEVIKLQLKAINTFDVSVSNLWAISYGQNDFTDWHNHGSLWDKMAYNVVLYLTDSPSPLIVRNRPNNISITPSQGLMVVMHPLTYHMVEPITDSVERLVIAMNFEYN